MPMITTETMKISYLHSPCLGIVFGTVCIALVMCLVAGLSTTMMCSMFELSGPINTTSLFKQ